MTPGVGAKNFGEFVSFVRRNPGKLSYGTTGSGSASHLTMELLKADAKLIKRWAAGSDIGGGAAAQQ